MTGDVLCPMYMCYMWLCFPSRYNSHASIVVLTAMSSELTLRLKLLLFSNFNVNFKLFDPLY